MIFIDFGDFLDLVSNLLIDISIFGVRKYDLLAAE